ncbi:MAG: alpha/beta hydrolase [Gemmatimonadaceae bacterium]
MGILEPNRREPFELVNEEGLPIRGEMWHAGRSRGTVIVCHGFKGFAKWGFFPLLAETLSRGGVGTITFNFSGSGVGADGESFTEESAFFSNSFSRELADLKLVEKEAERREWLGANYGLFGHSRGGGIAILHAARQPLVRALATWAAISTVDRWSGDVKKKWREDGRIGIVNARTGQVLALGTAGLDDVEKLATSDLDILSAASRIAIPWLIAHGTMDEAVPFTEGEKLAKAATSASVETLTIAGGNHTFGAQHPLFSPVPSRTRRVITRTLSFFREHFE